MEEEEGGESGHTGKRELTVCFPQVRHQSISMMIDVVFKVLWKVSSPLCTTRRYIATQGPLPATFRVSISS